MGHVKRNDMIADIIRRKQVQFRRYLVISGNTGQPHPSGFNGFVTLLLIMQ